MERTRGDSVFLQEVDSRGLMIGRMEHICDSKKSEKEEVRGIKGRKSLIVLEEE